MVSWEQCGMIKTNLADSFFSGTTPNEGLVVEVFMFNASGITCWVAKLELPSQDFGASAGLCLAADSQQREVALGMVIAAYTAHFKKDP